MVKVDKARTAYARLLKKCEKLKPLRIGVVHPCNDEALEGVAEACKEGLIEPVLIAPRAKLEAAAKACGFNLKSVEVVDVPHSHAAAAIAVQMVHDGRLEGLMKGSIHSSEFLEPMLRHDSGLRTERRASHAYLIAPQDYDHPLIITDAAINIAPGLPEKADIVQNAIELAQALGKKQPKVAILSAVETVTSKIPSTIDAAALCKMADRGQIVGGVLDGPLGFDNAINLRAAKAKGISSPVAGSPDILVAPNIESGNMLAKQMIFMDRAGAAGIVLGLSVPVILTSRADGPMSRSASCAVALLMWHNHTPLKGLKVV